MKSTFLEFSTNCLAAVHHPPCNSSHLSVIWVPEEELPGSKLPIARRHMLDSPSFLGFVELSGDDEHPPGDADQFGSILLFWGSSTFLIKGKWN